MVPNLEFLEVRERFLPVKQASLRQRMLRDPRLSDEERQRLDKLFEMIGARFHFEFRERLEHLKTVYDPFDPDRDTLPLDQDPADEPAQREELAGAFEQLLLGANYVEMPREQIIACAEYQSQTGLAVEASLSDYAELRVFYRGMRCQERAFRPWLTPWRRTLETVHVFSRIAVLVRLAREPSRPVFLKLFKNVVAEDLEMLLPYVRVHMRLMDHLKIGSSVVGGVATAGWKALTAAILSWWVFLVVMSGFVGAAVRGVFGFFSSKAKYLQAITASLYFQNLANNASALAHLIDAAEAEECKELLLAYYLLYVERNRDYAQEDLDRRVEEWLAAEFGLNVDFEVPDAVRKLLEKDLLVRRAPATPGCPATDGVLKVYDLPSALRRLDAVWDCYYAYNGTISSNEDRLADGDWPPYPEPAPPQAEAAALRRIDAGQSPVHTPQQVPSPGRGVAPRTP
jgi:hypothetical protein